MLSFAIVFDFPDADGEPWYAGRTRDGALGLVRPLARALKFTSEAAADRTLANGYGPSTRPYGTIVEVIQP